MAAESPHPIPTLPTGRPASTGLAARARTAAGGFLLHALALRDVLAWLSLALATLAVLWPLGLTDRVLAGVDALTYFTPYWGYRLSALRAGQIPLWNPYLFLGAPFLANPQAAVLYPLHWPLSWLSPACALIWSALLHTWLAAGFTYTFARRSLGLTRPAAWLAGVLFGLSGFSLARVENINQLNVLAWLPAALWLLDETAAAKGWPARLRWGMALAVVLAMQFLAGHTQTMFVNLVGLGLYAAYPVMASAVARVGIYRLRRRPGDRRGPTGETEGQHPAGERQEGASLFALSLRRLAPLLALVPALLLSAAQLLPSLELNGLGLRAGGLAYRVAVSFSLRPRLLAQTFLPPFGARLAEAFTSEGYAEFVSYVGIAGLALASFGAFGLWRSLHLNNRTRLYQQTGRRAMLLLVAVGILLALGAYNPLYYLLWRFVPGFALFRVPARWLALYALGAAALAGVGLDGIATRQTGSGLPWDVRVWACRLSRPAALALLLGTLALFSLAAYQQWPGLATLAGWGLAAAATGGLLWMARRRPCAAQTGLIALTLAELWLGSRALPFVQATAPLALGLRNAPAALLAAGAGHPPAGRDRFLSLSDIRFDPGDLADLRKLESDRLPAAAVDLLVRSAKQMEVIAPNLSLLLGLPSVDGYDGGVLPLSNYVKLSSLFLPPGQVSTDGRLREQLRQIPPDRLLDLTGTRFVITDKQNDLWANDVYYDLEQPVTIRPGDTLTLVLSGYPDFSATAVGLVSYLSEKSPTVGPVATITITRAGTTGGVQLGLSAPTDTTSAQTVQPGATVARPWPDWMGQGQDYLAIKDFSAGCPGPLDDRGFCPFAAGAIRLQVLPAAGSTLVIRGLSLIDRRTGAHESITLSPRGDYRRIESGDVKVYERTGAPGRAWLVHQVQPVADDAGALALLADPTFDPRKTAVLDADHLPVSLSGAGESSGAAQAGVSESVNIQAAEPERIVMQAQVSRPGLLVLADAFYPGWQATIDGRAAGIERVNVMFRAVVVQPGTHQVVFSFRPASWRRGIGISLASIILLAATLAITCLVSRARRRVKPGDNGTKTRREPAA
jgi:hypothetical protein